MEKMVKHVFTFLMWVTIAWLLYLAFFGTYSLQGRNIADGDAAYTGNTTQTVAWKGLLWYASLSAENPISKYYYEFCMVPNIHASDYVDEALGGSAGTATNPGGLFETETDLEHDSDMYSFSGGYTTGWS